MTKMMLFTCESVPRAIKDHFLVKLAFITKPLSILLTQKYNTCQESFDLNESASYETMRELMNEEQFVDVVNSTNDRKLDTS